MIRTLQRILIVCALANLAVAVWDTFTGGIYFRLFGFAFSSWDLSKPIRYAAMCGAVALWLRDRGAATTSWDIVPQLSAGFARALAIASIVVAGLFGIRAAGGSDAYGYVSQAQLWAEGRLIAPEPLAPLGQELGLAVAPLGYTLTPARDALVPTYPPGLPLAMAAAQRLAGPQAVFVVVPLLGGVAIWMTYLIGLRVADARVGLVAALLVASSPLFMFHTFEPMSDIPATAWWTAAWATALAPGAWATFCAGAAVAGAVLTRPNLAPLALVLLPVVLGREPRAMRAIMFVAAAAIGAATIAAVNAALYGSPLVSGYGALDQLFGREHLWPNLGRYTRWMLELHGPIVLLAVVAPLARRTRVVLWMWMFCVGVGLSYAFYVVFDHWPFARFLLPSLPLVFVLVAIVLLRAIEALPRAARGAALLVVCTALGSWYLTIAERLGMFTIQHAEQRYATVGRQLGDTLSPNAIVLSMIESGSVRWHGRRLTLRWDFIPPDRLDETLALLGSKGYAAYLLLEDWEEPLFRQQFANHSALGNIDWPPALEYQGAGRVRLYRVADRARHLSGERIVTRPIAAP